MPTSGNALMQFAGWRYAYQSCEKKVYPLRQKREALRLPEIHSLRNCTMQSFTRAS